MRIFAADGAVRDADILAHELRAFLLMRGRVGPRRVERLGKGASRATQQSQKRYERIFEFHLSLTVIADIPFQETPGGHPVEATDGRNPPKLTATVIDNRSYAMLQTR